MRTVKYRNAGYSSLAEGKSTWYFLKSCKALLFLLKLEDTRLFRSLAVILCSTFDSCLCINVKAQPVMIWVY